MYDPETRLYYLRSRYYNAYRGRFLNADSVFDGANLFCYCGNEPIHSKDDNGLYRVPVPMDIICDCLDSPHEPSLGEDHYHTAVIDTDGYIIGTVVGGYRNTRKRWYFRSKPVAGYCDGQERLLDPGTSLYVKIDETPGADREWLEALLIHDNGYVQRGYIHAERIWVDFGGKTGYVNDEGRLNVRSSPRQTNGNLEPVHTNASIIIENKIKPAKIMSSLS